MWFGIICGILSFFVIFTFIVYNIYKNFVIEHSLVLNRIRLINEKYHFNEIHLVKFEISYDNENYYDNVTTQDYLTYELQFKQKEVKEQIRLVLENYNMYELYTSDINDIDCENQYDVEIPFKFKKLLYWIENRETNNIIMNPIINFRIFVRVTLTNINGRFKSSKSKYYDIETVESLMERLKDKTNGRFSDEKIWKSISTVERAKVSNKLRFAIYNRDHNRCVKCGSRYNLEIDHIIPISKGGKTEFSNLQTLCKNCNQKKANVIEAYNDKTYNPSVKYCPKCKAPLKLICGKYGKFYGCTNYPRCDYKSRY